MEWLARLLGRDGATLADIAAPIVPGSSLFLPHLQGERAPLWDISLRGTFAGLTAATGPAEMAAAVMEGVAFSARLALEALQRAGDVVPASLRVGGGGMASDRWCQIRANALNRRLERVSGKDPGAVGAALMTGLGCSAMANLAEAAERLVKVDRIFTPDPAMAALSDVRFTLWRDLILGARSVNARLAKS